MRFDDSIEELQDRSLLGNRKLLYTAHASHDLRVGLMALGRRSSPRSASGVELKRIGYEHVGRCPWHSPDTHPSLSANQDKGAWRCFACAIGGSCFDWVMKRDGVSFRRAKEILAARLVGLAPTPGRSLRCTLPSTITLDADDRQLLRDVVDYYWQTLKREPGPQDYLRRRGLVSDELVDVFKLGYANRTLAYRLPPKSKHHDRDVRGRLMKLGILREETGHEHLAGSLTVPVFDENGDVVELFGRKVLDNLRAGTPRHLYLARKGRSERGVWNWQGLAEETILCEALLDALTFWKLKEIHAATHPGAKLESSRSADAHDDLASSPAAEEEGTGRSPVGDDAGRRYA